MHKHLLLFLLILWGGSGLLFGQDLTFTTYDFTDGTVAANGETSDGVVKLGGTYAQHGDKYGLNLKADGQISVAVQGSATIRFLGSVHSGLEMTGTAETTGDLGVQSTRVENDLQDTYAFTYAGPATTLVFTLATGEGNDLYLPSLDVIPAQPGMDFSEPDAEIVYYFDFRDGSIVPTDTEGQSDLQAGLLDLRVGTQNAYGFNGAQHGVALKPGNQVEVAVAGNSLLRLGGSIYSNGMIEASSTTGSFEVDAMSATASGNYGNDGATLDFLYVGEAGTVTFDFTGTTYLPYLEIVPLTYAVTLAEWVAKAGTVTVNGVDINLQSGADATVVTAVTVSEGTVISSTAEMATVLIDLGGEPLANYTPTFSGDVAGVAVQGDSLLVTYTDETTDPTDYVVVVRDASQVPEAEPGKTYTYNFANGTVLPQISYQELRYTTFVSEDGLLTIRSNTETEAQQFGYHDASHGGVFFPGNSFSITVAGNALITFLVDTYGSAEGATFAFRNADGDLLGSIAAENIGDEDGFPSTFAYTGPATTLTATLMSDEFPTAEVYIHGLSVQNEDIVVTEAGKADVWDFGAAQLDAGAYVNKLDAATINAWYDPSIEEGTSGHVLPDFTTPGLSFIGGGNDRLRTTNTALTRYDENISSAGDYTGRIYVNSAGAVGRYLSLTLNADDEVTLAVKTDAGGTINFEYAPDPAAQTDMVPMGSDLTEMTFTAQRAGIYHIFDTQGKPSYYRVTRTPATYVSLSGSIDVSNAEGLSEGYGVQFTNEAGKVFTADVSDDEYTVELPAGKTYELSLSGANGYVIGSTTSIAVTEETTELDITIVGVELYTVSGSIEGLGDLPMDFELLFTPDTSARTVYQPQPVVNVTEATYTVALEAGTLYLISALGVNDFSPENDSLTIAGDTTVNLRFTAKPTYAVALTVDGLTEAQKDDLQLTFTNTDEEGYTYTFSDLSAVMLRSGSYRIDYSGLDAYPVELAPTSRLTVADGDTSKMLSFVPVHLWSFADREITQANSAYRGLLFTGGVSNEVGKGHLVAAPGATIRVPVNPGEVVKVSYYYYANLSIEGGATFGTESGSTSLVEDTTYAYTGDAAGYVTLTVGGDASTYLTEIETYPMVEYSAMLRVGTDKDYQTINDALAAVRRMEREAGERVTVMIDPGNYEEMLVIDMPELTLSNATVDGPGIGLLNQGVDIAENAVRITSYYGHGYDYYSMGTDQKYDADALRVNRENGFLGYENVGAGTTNGSYWNATVVVTADDFVAEHIIFENSFNQYISRKESEDIVVMWDSGSRGERPTNYGNTDVQDRSYVERAAAIAVAEGADRMVLDECRVVGRQDSFFGGRGSRVVAFRGSMMGAVDYLFGGMTAVFYESDLAMNVSDASNDRSYLTAAQQSEPRGYLMYECTVTSAAPGTESASTYRAKPGYFGRPWEATTSEVVFYNTTIETSDYPGEIGESLILPLGWQNTLGGESEMMYEYGTVELSGVDNSDTRADWATVLEQPVLNDGTDITPYNFTKGDDGWDPLPALIAENPTSLPGQQPESEVVLYGAGNRLYVTNVTSNTRLRVYDLQGKLLRAMDVDTDRNFPLPNGLWIVVADDHDGRRVGKVYTRN
ncbi:pectinesterase family protein [Lewinella sp. IMCC34183]|uniref:pectinesterase family protein n=1 Tax=Lewinella sp. IMCC34183 TaxID=2248762 RepID=UPI001E5BE005|nr:pectinesterase family protein [Lewinella sp. IMCC34183]